MQVKVTDLYAEKRSQEGAVKTYEYTELDDWTNAASKKDNNKEGPVLPKQVYPNFDKKKQQPQVHRKTFANRGAVEGFLREKQIAKGFHNFKMHHLYDYEPNNDLVLAYLVVHDGQVWAQWCGYRLRFKNRRNTQLNHIQELRKDEAVRELLFYLREVATLERWLID